MICKACGRSLRSRVFPLRCVCGAVTTAGDCGVEQPPKPSLWEPLHRYPVDHFSAWDSQQADIAFRHWEARICQQCLGNWMLVKRELPPVFTSPEAHFAWSVAAHSQVSQRHVRPPKPAMSLDEAERLYGVPWRCDADG